MFEFDLRESFSSELLDSNQVVDKNVGMEIFLIIETPEMIAKREEEARQLQDRIIDTVLDEDLWKKIPGHETLRISKTGKIMEVIFSDDNDIADIIPVSMTFNQMSRQLEVNLSTADKVEVYSIQELMAIAWLGYKPSENTKVVLTDGNPTNLTIENIAIEIIEE